MSCEWLPFYVTNSKEIEANRTFKRGLYKKKVIYWLLFFRITKSWWFFLSSSKVLSFFFEHEKNIVDFLSQVHLTIVGCGRRECSRPCCLPTDMDVVLGLAIDVTTITLSVCGYFCLLAGLRSCATA